MKVYNKTICLTNYEKLMAFHFLNKRQRSINELSFSSIVRLRQRIVSSADSVVKQAISWLHPFGKQIERTA